LACLPFFSSSHEQFEVHLSTIINFYYQKSIPLIFFTKESACPDLKKPRSAKIKELDLASLRDSDSFNFYDSLCQERLQNYQNGLLEYRYYIYKQLEHYSDKRYKIKKLAIL